MSTGLRRTAFSLLVLLALALVFWYANRPRPIPVRVHTVAYGTVEETVANTRVGSVKACRRSRLSPEIGGQIERLWVEEGDSVKQGQLLLSLWNRDFQAQVALAKNETEVARASADAACLRAENARRQAARLPPLYQRNLVSEEAVDQANTEAKALTEECRAAKATITVQEARLDLAEAQLAKTLLYAPFNGVVAEVYGEEGEYATPSPPAVPTPPAVDLISAECFYISAPIDEIDSGHLAPGLEARIHIDAFGERQFPGRLRRIAPYVSEVEKQARTVEVEVDFLQPEDEALQRPGYSADVEIILARQKNTLRIPTEAVREADLVLVLEQDRLVERRIETGLSNWDWSEVRQGLSAGEAVVLSLDREGVQAGAEAYAEEK